MKKDLKLTINNSISQNLPETIESTPGFRILEPGKRYTKKISFLHLNKKTKGEKKCL